MKYINHMIYLIRVVYIHVAN